MQSIILNNYKYIIEKYIHISFCLRNRDILMILFLYFIIKKKKKNNILNYFKYQYNDISCIIINLYKKCKIYTKLKY